MLAPGRSSGERSRGPWTAAQAIFIPGEQRLMHVDWVIPCRYCEVNGNMVTIVGGNIDRITVPMVPALDPLRVLCGVRVVADHDEVDREPTSEPPHRMITRVYGPSLDLVNEMQEPFGLVGEFPEDIQPAVVMPIAVIFTPEAEGQHTIEIAIDDRGRSAPLSIVVNPAGDD